MEDKLIEAINLLFNKFPTTQAMYKHYIYYKLINTVETLFWVIFLFIVAILFMYLWYVVDSKYDMYKDYYYDCTFGRTKEELNRLDNRLRWLEKDKENKLKGI